MKKNLAVLCVDDDEFQLEFVGDMLRELGVDEVATANQGRKGIAMLESLGRQPDLLLCDLDMPDMDGIAFLRHLAERDYPGGVAVLSGMDGSLRQAAHKLAQAYSLNLVGVMEKPAKRDALQALLGKLGVTPHNKSGSQPEVPISRLELEEGLAEGHLEAFFQPQVSLTEKRVVGVECLARWRHPERGLLGPGAFIAVAEQHGLIDQLTMSMLTAAVKHAAEWKSRGHALRVAVNLSADNLNRIDLPETIDSIAREADVEPRQIVLEITESSLMKDVRLSLDILARLRLKGFSLSVDDFGTGYSNMEKLKQLPFSELKVDRAFVCGAASDPTSRAILESSVQLGRSLGMNLVAEGVETQADWDLVAEFGCDEAQGYFLARPMPADAVLDWKREWEGDVTKDEDNERPLVMNVDDESMMREIAQDMLGGSFRVRAAENGEDCLRQLRQDKVDLILLDVEMPGIDGYETCRRIRADADLTDTPVIFLSGHDRIEDRLRGYEAGGDDYVVKPFDPIELESKVRNLLRLNKEREQHKQMASYASSTAMTAMASLGEMGVLIESMKKFINCGTLPAIANSVLDGLTMYGLAGAVQIRAGEKVVTYDHEGEASPLVVSVINHMRTMDRITFFKTRMSISYEAVSLLVDCMPVDDPDRYGRLRDHLAMLTEAANVRIRAILLSDALNVVAENLIDTLADIDAAQRQSRVAINLELNMLNEEIARAYVTMGLTDSQEECLSDTVRRGIDNVLHAESISLNVQDKLTGLTGEIKRYRDASDFGIPR